MVVNSKMVGKKESSSTSFANIHPNIIENATAMLQASKTSNNWEGMGIMNITNADSKYNATPKSAFLTPTPPLYYAFPCKWYTNARISATA